MFKETNDGQTQYCPMCEKWAEKYEQLKAEKEENEHQINMILAEKINLNKIIDRLLENAGFSKDIASAEDFETVYEILRYKNNKFEEYQQALEEIREIAKLHQYFNPEILEIKEV